MATPTPTMSERMAAYMEEPLRGFVREMPRVLSALGVAPGMVVADVGAGTGGATEALAKIVAGGGSAAGGRVFALELSPAFLDGLRARQVRLFATDPAASAAIAVTASGECDLGGGVPDGSCDLALMVDVAHHLRQPADFARALARALKAGSGRVAVVEHDRAAFVEAVARAHPRAFLQLLQANLQAPPHADHEHHHDHHHDHDATGPSHGDDGDAEPSAEVVAAAVVQARALISKAPTFSPSAFSDVMRAAGLTLSADLAAPLGIADIAFLLVYTKLEAVGGGGADGAAGSGTV